MPWDTDVTESQEFRIISRLTQPDPSISTAIHQLLDLTSVAAASTTVSTSEALLLHFDNTWQALIEIVVANTAPAQQAVLVKFVQTLQQQKVLDPATGDQLRFDQDYNMRVWTDSPNFGINLADHWNFNPMDPSPDPEEETRYLNKVAFLAQLTSSPTNFLEHSEHNPRPIDFSLYALWLLRTTFENTTEPRAPNMTLLRAASLWMIYATDRLWKNVLEKRDFRHKATGTNPAEEGRAYLKPRTGWIGFNKARWEVWVKGLENGRETNDTEVRALVERALEQVERVEDQSWRLTESEKYA